MGKNIWIGRRPAIGMTRASSLAEARLILGAIGEQCSLAAAPIFMLSRKGPATEGEAAALRLPRRLPPHRRGPAAKSLSRKGSRT